MVQDEAIGAKAEKDRLKQQQQQKKQLIEKMREEQNALAEQGEVRAVSTAQQMQPVLSANVGPLQFY